MYPMMLNMEGKRCLVVGGGKVALRKTKGLLKHNAEILVISPELCTELAELHRKGIIRWVKECYRERHLEGVCICFACTDSKEVNETIAFNARNHNILVNVADNSSISTFTVPAVRKKGDITLAVYSDENPAASRYMADFLLNAAEDWIIQYVSEIKEIRNKCKEKVHDAKLRQDFMRSLFEPQAIEMARRDLESALCAARDKLENICIMEGR